MRAIGFTLVLAVTGCAEGASPRDYAAIDTMLYLFDTPEATAEVEAFRASLPFDSMEFAHLGCLGTCPQYRLLLRRDGTATYSGGAFSPRSGEVTDTLGLVPYARLCQFIEVEEIVRELEERGPSGTVDWDAHRMRFWPTGLMEPVEFAGGFVEGPASAWALRRAADGLVLQLLWEPDWPESDSSQSGGRWR